MVDKPEAGFEVEVHAAESTSVGALPEFQTRFMLETSLGIARDGPTADIANGNRHISTL